MPRTKGLNFRKKKKKVNLLLLREIAIWFVELLIAVLLAGVLVYFFGARTTVVGSSMAEQLQEGDQVLINRFIYTVSHPKIGDVIVFLPNGNEKSHYYIKRVIASGGDTVQIRDGVIYVNGEPSEDVHFTGTIADPGVAAESVKLDADECFVLGDNPAGSEDSRYANIGNVKYDYIIGRAWFRLLPLSEMGLVK